MLQKYKVYINNKPKIITDYWDDFSSNYKLINAAGGVVYNNSNQLLMILRNGIWDLPKGKIENNEDITECAIREVGEECGISDLKVIQQLCETYHTYHDRGLDILKRTYWFRMKTNHTTPLKPQIEEGITRACWINKELISDKDTFGNIKDLLDAEGLL